MTEAFSSKFVRSIDANRTIKDSLVSTIGSTRPRSRISVTDLVSPMQAFHRWTHPKIRPSPDRLQVMMSGTGFHETFGKLVSTEEYLEQLLELDGIVGLVDIYEDIPVEVKTTSSIPSDIYKGRSSYFEQLAMYCAMARNDTGRLIVYQRQSDKQPSVLKVYEVVFSNLERIAEEMRARRDLFKNALENKDPSGLPQCEWLYRGCDYSKVCPCRSKDPVSPIVERDEIQLSERPDVVAELRDKLETVVASKTGLRLNDLVFPRKAALRINNHTETDTTVPVEDRLKSLEKEGFRHALYSAIRNGLKGQFESRSVELGSISDKVDIYDGAPTVLRTSGLKRMVERDNLTSFFSHYFDRIAFECALTNLRKGRIILYYEQIPDDKFMVYDVSFHSRKDILREASRRLELLESRTSHTELPSCPSWMAEYCDMAPDCLCGEQIGVQ